MATTPHSATDSVLIAQPRSARQILVDWANQQDSWVRGVAVDVLVQGQDLNQTQLARHFEQLLLEKQLAEGQPVPLPPIRWEGALNNHLPVLRLVNLKHLRGVNALIDDQEIVFNPHMTLCYGENATGKTGYVRILKRLASVKSAEDVLPDIYAVAPPSPSAIITYQDQEARSEYAWKGESGVEPFTRLAIFDARAVHVHLDDDLTYRYTPGDLALFKYVHNAIEGIKALLDTRRQQTQPRGNPFLVRFQRGTVVYPLIEALGASTDLQRLGALAAMTDEESAELASLRTQVPVLKGTIGREQAALAVSQRDLLRSIYSIGQRLVGFDFAGYAVKRASLTAAVASQEKAASQLFAGLPVDIRDSTEWKGLIQAADEYVKHLETPDYPHAGDVCVYCRQPLAPEAVALIHNYQTYLNDELARETQKAQGDLAVVVAPLKALNLEATRADLERLLPTFADREDLFSVLTSAATMLEKGRQQLAEMEAAAEIEPSALVAAANELLPAMLGHGKAASEQVRALQADTETKKKIVDEQTKRLAELEARDLLRQSIGEIERFVRAAKWAYDATRLIRDRIPAVARQLTIASKEAGEQLLNQDFERKFQEECTALRAPRVQLYFPGRGGEPARRKSVSEGHRLSEIMSDGEQRLIALADFLAEAALRGAAAPIVFDDPVTSLNYRRLPELISRLRELSDSYQVVVFTHSILLAAGLLLEFEEAGARDRLSYFEVSEAGGRKGLVTPSRQPRVDTPPKIAGEIEQAIKKARSGHGDDQAHEIERGYELIRSWVEAFVEKELFADVVQRYTPHIGITKLMNVKPERMPQALSIINPIFEKACRYMRGHSQPIEALGVRPTVDELSEDWLRLKQARAAYLAS